VSDRITDNLIRAGETIAQLRTENARLRRERDAVARWIEHAKARPHDSQAALVSCLEDWLADAACQEDE
jgi:seryl-tRNA synthetase